MSEGDFGVIALSRYVKSYFGARPLGLVFRKVQLAVQNQPKDLSAGDQLRDLLLRIVDVFVAIRELITEFVGAAFNISCPPTTDIVDCCVGFFGSLIYRKASCEVVHLV